MPGSTPLPQRVRPQCGNAVDIEYRPVGALHASPHSARTHSARQRRKLKRSLEQFGFVLPLLVTGNGEIIDGSLRWETAGLAGFDAVPVIIVDHLSGPEVRALRLALNRIPLDAGWDSEKLRTELSELLSLGMDLDLTGFDAPEIDMHLAVDDPGDEGRMDELPSSIVEPRGPAVTKAGDILTLGPHRIACGDARDQAILTSLLAGRTAQMVFADPPYNLRIEGVVSGLGRVRHAEFAMASGEMSKDDYAQFLRAFLGSAAACLDDGGLIFACMDWRQIATLLMAGEAVGLELKNVCVWAKTNAGMGSFYRSQHELVAVLTG